MKKHIIIIFIICLVSCFTLSAQSNNALKPSAFTMGCCDVLNDCLSADQLFDNGGYVYPTAPFQNHTMFGQIFKGSATYTVTSIDTYFFIVMRGVPSSNYDVLAHIYTLDENNLPSELLATSLPVKTGSMPLYRHAACTFTFLEPVKVPGNFVVIIDFTEVDIRSTLIAISTSPAGCYKEGQENYIIAYDDRGWLPILSSWSNMNMQQKDLFNLAIFVNVEEPVSLKSQNKQTFTVSPNPATDIIYIENAEESNLRVISMTGKMTLERTIQSTNEAIGISDLEKGVYFIEITKDNSRSIQKLIKK